MSIESVQSKETMNYLARSMHEGNGRNRDRCRAKSCGGTNRWFSSTAWQINETEKSFKGGVITYI
jgi:hypothetical protein